MEMALAPGAGGPGEALETDNVRSVVSNALSICKDRNLKVKSAVMAFFVRTLELEGGWKDGASIKGKLDPATVLAMAKTAVANLPGQGSPSLATLNMQVCMEEEYTRQQELVEREHNEREDRKFDMLRTILSPALANEESPAVLKKLLGKVFEYVCYAGGMEPAAGAGPAHDEVRAAMESVFPVSMLSRFLTLELEEKQTQMEELANIVLGIIMYNREQGIGGAALPNSQHGFFSQAQKLDADMESRAAALDEELNMSHKFVGLRAPSVPPNEPEMTRLSAEIINRYQHRSFLNRMRMEVRASVDSVRELEDEISARLAEIVNAVGDKTSVSKDKIYPMFEQAGALQMALRDEHRLLVVHYRLLERLDELSGGFKLTASKRACHDHRHDPKGAPKVAPDSPETPDDMAAAEAMAGTKRVFPESLSDGDMLSLAGFCPVTMVRRYGLLVPGKLEIGIANVDGKLYSCADNEELAVFSANPEEWVQAASSMALVVPELCYLMNLHQEFPELSIKAAVELMVAPMSCDSGTQTPTHFVEKFIDVNYNWNEWALRRRALQLANLRDKRTHSQQTDKSHFRRDNDAQVWLPKKATTQTASNKGQTMTQKKRYIAGLRGSPATRMNIVSLDLDIGQPHQRKF
mmetsp:Transcript_15175/g.39232  ORF Transcript_15175/g.39232 Transcript_15175/m.39232 type:complete len:636 (-) Transcript_15175:115-2022(-)